MATARAPSDPDYPPPRALPEPSSTPSSSLTNSALLEGHRVHLRDLIRRERSAAYRRVDYLNRAWQARLWREEVKGALRVRVVQDSRRSPSSVAGPDATGGADRGADARHRRTVPAAPSEVCARWREKIVEWKYRIVDRFDLDRQLVSISTFYLDRYLASKFVDEELFQLAAMASLYLAAKTHSSRKIGIHCIASSGNGLLKVEHVEAMELSLVKDLDWRLMPPTAAGFVENFYPVLAARCGAGVGGAVGDGRWDEALTLSRFLCELSVCAYPFIAAAPSSVALAAVLCGLARVGLLSGEARGHCANLAAGLGLDVEGNEVRACGALLRRVHQLAAPGGNQGRDRRQESHPTPVPSTDAGRSSSGSTTS